MNLQSLGYKSELVFLNFDGKVDQRDSYLVMRTLTNPNYFWGNLLVYNRPPQKGDCSKWVETFKKEFTDPRIYHITLAWDAPAGGVCDVTEFLEKGFELEAKAVLAASKVVPPPKFNKDLVVKTLGSPGEGTNEWQAMIELQVNSAHDNLPRHEWEGFYQSQSTRYQKMSQAGLGHWYGGFLNEKLVAGLGIFHSDGIGRFQIVCTDPNYRRQGLCGTLVYQAALHALEKFKLKHLVMCADPDYYAIKIYESVGFKRQQTEYGVYWWDKNR